MKTSSLPVLVSRERERVQHSKIVFFFQVCTQLCGVVDGVELSGEPVHTCMVLLNIIYSHHRPRRGRGGEHHCKYTAGCLFCHLTIAMLSFILFRKYYVRKSRQPRDGEKHYG